MNEYMEKIHKKILFIIELDFYNNKVFKKTVKNKYGEIKDI